MELFKICFWLYYAGINIITFVLYGVDKARAIRDEWRIKESTLLGFSFFGGAAGGLLAMVIFRHKIRKPAFAYGVPLMLILHAAAIAWIMDIPVYM